MSIGIALTSPAKTCDDVLHDADVAMYEAKAKGKNGYEVYQPSLQEAVSDRLERTAELDKLVFIGVRRRGVPLAQRLAKKIEDLEGRKIPVGVLDINLYRDDLSTVGSQPVVNATDIPFSVTGKDVTLSGTVTSWWQRRLARNSAWNAPGVQNVTDHMTIGY